MKGEYIVEQLQIQPNPHTPFGNVPVLHRDSPVILHCGRDLALLSTRSRVLALTGAPVERCHGVQALDAMLHRYTQGLLVLCHSLTECERTAAVSRIKTLPAFTGLLLVRGYAVPLQEMKTVNTGTGPHGLLQTATALLAAQKWSDHPQWASA